MCFCFFPLKTKKHSGATIPRSPPIPYSLCRIVFLFSAPPRTPYSPHRSVFCFVFFLQVKVNCDSQPSSISLYTMHLKSHCLSCIKSLKKGTKIRSQEARRNPKPKHAKTGRWGHGRFLWLVMISIRFPRLYYVESRIISKISNLRFFRHFYWEKQPIKQSKSFKPGKKNIRGSGKDSML